MSAWPPMYAPESLLDDQSSVLTYDPSMWPSQYRFGFYAKSCHVSSPTDYSESESKREILKSAVNNLLVEIFTPGPMLMKY